MIQKKKCSKVDADLLFRFFNNDTSKEEERKFDTLKSKKS